MTEVPIACTLSHEGIVARQSLIDALTADALLERTPTDAGVRVRLRHNANIERRTRALVAAESRCCAFLAFDLRRVAGALVLDISGPPEARPVIDLFFASGGHTIPI
jgi:hypothetical protein